MTDLVQAPANPNIPQLRPGDSVSVHVRVREGDSERVQEFRGTVIRLRKGGNNANFTVRRIASHGIGVERTFLLRSPRIEKVEFLYPLTVALPDSDMHTHRVAGPQLRDIRVGRSLHLIRHFGLQNARRP